MEDARQRQLQLRGRHVGRAGQQLGNELLPLDEELRAADHRPVDQLGLRVLRLLRRGDGLVAEADEEHLLGGDLHLGPLGLEGDARGVHGDERPGELLARGGGQLVGPGGRGEESEREDEQTPAGVTHGGGPVSGVT